MKKITTLVAALALCSAALATNNITRGMWTACRGAVTASCTGTSQLGSGLASEQDCVNIIIARTDTTSQAYSCREAVTALQVPPAPVPPTVSLTAAPNPVTIGSPSTLNWSTTNATDCLASNGWAGARAPTGSESTGPLQASTAYTLTCNGPGGTGSGSVTVNAVAAPPAGTQYGLEWPGTGPAAPNVRRMLYWANPHTSGLPAYPATYIFRVLPKGPKTTQFNYWTTFFWGNNGDFSWGSGSCRSFYGAHPYPFNGDASTSGQNWEIAVDCGDVSFVTPNGTRSVDWNRWHTQAMRVWKDGSTWRHEFYFDLPDTSKVITYNSTQTRINPPHPALVMGQAPDIGGVSWGLYPGWEEFKGVIRGIQVYSVNLDIADILTELVTPQSTAAGNASIWYLNTNPRPSDVTDKKVGGVPHNPAWDGSTAFEWIGP